MKSKKIKDMSNWKLFDAMNKAEKRWEKLRREFERRKLDKKPFVEWGKR